MFLKSNLLLMLYLLLQILSVIFAFSFLIKNRFNIVFYIASFFIIIIPSITIYFYKDWISFIYLLISNIIVFYFFTRDKISILHSFIIFILAIISDHIISFGFALINLQFNNDFTLIIARSISFIIIFNLFIFLYRWFTYKYIKINSIPNKISLLGLCIVFITLIFFYINLFHLSNRVDLATIKFNTFLFIFYFIFMIILLAFILKIFFKEQKFKEKETQYENFLIYVSMLEKANKDVQKFRHDYINILLTLKNFIDTNNLNDLRLYFEESILNFEKKTLDDQKILNHLKNIEVLGLKGLITSKAIIAQEQNILFSLEVPSTIQNIDFNLINLTRILGIFLDNAIESAQNCTDGSIQLALLNLDELQTLIIIKNSLDNASINIADIFNDSSSSKGNGRGLGLSIVKQIIESEDNVILNTHIEGCYFIQELLIRKRV